jgi:hypothetical protein
MQKQKPEMEWLITENEAEWQHLQAQPLPENEPVANRSRSLPYYFWSGVALCCLLLVSMDDWWWHATHARNIPVPAVTLAIAQAELAPAFSSTVLISTATVQQHVVAVQGDTALVEILVSTQPKALAYRQARFYRRTPRGWVQTAPDANLWGAESSLQTPYFLFRFRQQDAATVLAVAPQMDALYTSLWSNLGLPIDPTFAKLQVDVSVAQSPGQISEFDAAQQVTVASPALYFAPVTLTDNQLLAQSLALPLLTYGLAQASTRDMIDRAWQPMLDGLYLWQVWDMDLPLTAWHEDVVKWLYIDLPATQHGQTVMLPKRYPELCVMYRLWLASPLQLHLPLLCTEQEREARYWASWSLSPPLTHLDQLFMPALKHDDWAKPPASHPGQTVAVATLIDYAVATYGKERLPLLIAGLGHYDRWATLIPAVYGVSTAEFEAGWQAYLTAHYGVSVMLPSNP